MKNNKSNKVFASNFNYDKKSWYVLDHDKVSDKKGDERVTLTRHLAFLPGAKKGIKYYAMYESILGEEKLVINTDKGEYHLVNPLHFGPFVEKYKPIYGKKRKGVAAAFTEYYPTYISISNYGVEKEFIRIQMHSSRQVLFSDTYTKVIYDKVLISQMTINLKDRRIYRFKDLEIKRNKKFKFTNATGKCVGMSSWENSSFIKKLPSKCFSHLIDLILEYNEKKLGYKPSYYKNNDINSKWMLFYSLVKYPIDNAIVPIMSCVSNYTYNHIFSGRSSASKELFDYLKIKPNKSLNKLLHESGVSSILLYKLFKELDIVKKEDNLIRLCNYIKLDRYYFENIRIIRGMFYEKISYFNGKHSWQCVERDRFNSFPVIFDFITYMEIYEGYQDETVAINKFVNADRDYLFDILRMYKTLMNYLKSREINADNAIDEVIVDKEELLRKIRRSSWDKDIHDYLCSINKKISHKNVTFTYSDEDHINEYSNDKYNLVLARDYHELIDVSSKMHICVGNSDLYKNGILNNLIHIYLVYDKENMPVVCIEYNLKSKTLSQVKGICNERLKEGDERREFIEEWLENKKINPLCYDLRPDYPYQNNNNLEYFDLPYADDVPPF